MHIYIYDFKMSENPLNSYFRKAKLTINLPSKGKFYSTESLEITDTNTYSVYPMTSSDEFLYQTPNTNADGEIVKKIIERCIPNIKNAWEIPSIDIDIIMPAIRLATYGNLVSIKSICPNCETDNTVNFDINYIFENIKYSTYDTPLQLDEMIIWFKPVSYKKISEKLLSNIDEDQILASTDIENTEDKELLIKLQEVYTKVYELTVDTLSHNIEKICVSDTTVTDISLIKDWLKNCEVNTFNIVKNTIIEKKNINALKPIDIKCKNCDHEYDQEVYLNQSNFVKKQ